MWSIHVMEFYSALKRKEILKHTTTRPNPEELSEIIPIMPSDIRQSHRKTNAVFIHLPQAPRAVRFIETGSSRMGVRGWGGGNGVLVSNTCKVSTWENGKTLKVDGGDGYIPT